METATHDNKYADIVLESLDISKKAMQYMKLVAISVSIAFSVTVIAVTAMFVIHISQYDYATETVLVETDGDGHANYVGGNGGINNGSKGQGSETEQDKEVQGETQVGEGT